MRNETVKIRDAVLNRVRVSLGLTREEFGSLVQCNARTVNKLLMGGCVRIRTARRVAESLNLSVSRVIDIDCVEVRGIRG